MIAIFDTNIVIDALKGIPQANTEYEKYERVLISQVTWMEVLIGEKGNERDFMQTHFEIIPIDTQVSEIAVQLRRAHKIKLPDAIVWATARSHAALLVTRNTKDFKPEWEGIRIPYILSPEKPGVSV